MIEAVADHVLIIRPEPASMTHGKIFLPNVARKPYAYGIVWRVGPKVTHVKPGEIVFFDSQACRDVPIADDEKTCFTVVVEDAIYLRLDPFTALNKYKRKIPDQATMELFQDDAVQPKLSPALADRLDEAERLEKAEFHYD